MSTFEKTLNNALQLTFTTLFFILIAGNVWGQTTVCYSFDGGSTSGTLDANISFTTHKNSGTAVPVINSGQLRLYQNSTKGGSIKIAALNGAVITDVVMTTASTGAGSGPAGYSVDNTTEAGSFPSGGVLAMNGLSASDYVEFYNKGSSSSARTYVIDFCVTYTMSPSGPSHDVIFDANGGTGTMANQTIAEGGSANLNSNTFTRSGYVFAGWNTNADGSGTSYADGDNFNMGSADVTLYAQWDVYVGPCVEESFESGLPTSYSDTETIQSLSSGAWIVRKTIRGTTGFTDGSYSAQIRSQADAYIITPTSTSTYTSFSLNVRGSTASSGLDIYYSTDNGVTWTLFNNYSFGTSNTSINGVLTIPNINKLKFQRSDGTVYLDEIEIFCAPIVPVCTPAATIFSFSPSSGPAETVVTITGSGFNGATAVKFGTTDAINFTIIDDNTITAKVPHAISETENISVFDASDCEAVSSSNYLLISDNDQCNGSPNFTDLFISEIYDSESGTLGYIELFNPTSAPIDLSALNYRLYRFGDITSGNGTNPTPTYNIPLTGTVAPNSTFVIKFGSDSGDGCSPYPASNQNYDDGFNDDDRFFLMKNGVRVDDISLPNYKGYNATRNTDATAPSVASGSYPTEGWTYTSSETCSNIGDYVVPVSSPAFDITHPDDVYAIVTPASFTMSVTPSGGTNPTYQWYFNDPISNNWLAVTSANLPGSLIVSGANTENLEISGSVSDIDAINNYQFYCEVKDGTCEIPSDAALFTIDNMLPITLTSFHATCANEKGSFSSIVWNTASESNSSHFVVEKSRDGINWGFVGERQAAGQSNSDISYYFIDENPFNGISYYRLRQVDYEGKEWIYGPISVRCEGQIESDISIYPNPNNGKFTIEISNSKADDNATLQLSDLTGKIIASERISLNKGTTQFFIDYPSLASGTYFVNLIGENSVLKRLKVVIGL
ncbi:MAG: InlB B-repeat-containing protein [Brumimicrobium sp.]